MIRALLFIGVASIVALIGYGALSLRVMMDFDSAFVEACDGTEDDDPAVAVAEAAP